MPDVCDNCPTVANQSQADSHGITAQPANYNFDTNHSGTTVTFLQSEWSSAINIGFAFGFFGATHSQLTVNRRGFITFDASPAPTFGATSSIPCAPDPDSLIALSWTDLFQTTGSVIEYVTKGTAPNRRFVLTYSNVQNESGTVTTQLVLFEGSNRAEVHTQTQALASFTGTTRGIEGPENATSGYQIGAYLPGENAEVFSLTNSAVYFTSDPTNADGIGDACDNTDDTEEQGCEYAGGGG